MHSSDAQWHGTPEGKEGANNRVMHYHIDPERVNVKRLRCV